MNNTLARAVSVAALTLGLVAVPATSYAGPGSVVTAAGPLTVYPDPYGDGSPNSTEGGQAAVLAVTTGGKTLVTVRVRGLAPNREYGAHAHVLGCTDSQGGGHYQNVPGNASPTNEIWLDFTTNSVGSASSLTVVDWVIRPDGANAVVIHDHETDPAGTAGPKLACLDVNF